MTNDEHKRLCSLSINIIISSVRRTYVLIAPPADHDIGKWSNIFCFDLNIVFESKSTARGNSSIRMLMEGTEWISQYPVVQYLAEA